MIRRIPTTQNRIRAFFFLAWGLCLPPALGAQQPYAAAGSRPDTTPVLTMSVITYENIPRLPGSLATRIKPGIQITDPYGAQENLQWDKETDIEPHVIRKLNELAREGWTVRFVNSYIINDHPESSFVEIQFTRYLLEKPME